MKAQPQLKVVESTPAPTITSLGMYKEGPDWKFIELKTVGDKVISRTITESGFRSVAWEQFRIKAVEEFKKEVL